MTTNDATKKIIIWICYLKTPFRLLNCITSYISRWQYI